MLSKLLVPDTLNYLIAGYLVISVVIGGYVISLAARWKRAVKQYHHLKEDLEG